MKYLPFCIALSLIALSCASDKKVNSSEHEVSLKQTEGEMNIVSNKHATEIEFVAIGNDPNWSLEIDFDQLIRFNTIPGDSITVPVSEPIITGKEEKYTHETQTSTLEVSITEEPCTDKISGEKFSHTVSIVLNGKGYQGCGRYTTRNEMSYEGRWILKSMDGERISQKNMNEMPMLEILEGQKEVVGYTGCNQLNGQVSVEGDNIYFEKLITTRMACPGNFEKRFLQALTSISEYKVVEEQLTLFRNGEEVMTFHKDQ